MSSFPYIYIRCPCADSLYPEPGQNTNINDQNTTTATPPTTEDEEQEQKPFNPHCPRSNFCVYPLEHLLWCESCHEIRCPRCVVEEIVCWFCPGCGFEVASSMVKSEGNRCTRNCYNCPCCTAGLFVTSLDPDGGAGAPWILVCEHCRWNSLDIGITFDRPNNIHGQLARMLGKARSKVTRMLDDLTVSDTVSEMASLPLRADPDVRFNQLLTFYKSELAKDGSGNNPLSNAEYSSPSNFARIMSLYTNTGAYGKKSSTRTSPMRGAVDSSEGLVLVDRSAGEAITTRLRTEGSPSTLTTTEQRIHQPHNPRFQSDLLPQATLLSTKRSRRCRTCRHILVKPESKITNNKYRIKLIALDHIPRITISHLPAIPFTQPTTTTTTITQPISQMMLIIKPKIPFQILLTFTNPLFTQVRVSLATPAQTPGRHAHKVTILCPEFTMGANADIWDEALGIGNEIKRGSKVIAAGSFSGGNGSMTGGAGNESKTAEAGKIWDRGRNWTSVVLEVVPASVSISTAPGIAGSKVGDMNMHRDVDVDVGVDVGEDEDILQIPVFVRLEYEAQTSSASASTSGSGAGAGSGAASAGSSERKQMGNAGDVGGKSKMEIAYWVVLGIGRVGSGGLDL